MHARKSARDAWFPTPEDHTFFATRGDVVFADSGAARRFAHRVDEGRGLVRAPEVAAMALVHEIFHLNDAAHATTGGRWWSERALGADYDAIVKKCGTSRACLAPFAPNHTTVRGGTYYAFQPGNGVVEYAAELALRYYREQRAVLFGLPRSRGGAEKPFKCGPPVNGRAWASMRDEFFGGVDVVPPCR